MNAPAKKSNRKPKPQSDARKQAEAAYAMAQKLSESAKSDQEKTLAASRIKSTREQLKAIKFTEIVPPRVARIANALNTLTKMANRSAYSWTPAQAEKVIEVLSQKVVALRSKLQQSGGPGKEKEGFSW